MQVIKIKTKVWTDIVEITPRIQKIVDEEKVHNELVHLFVIGSTASLSTCEDDENIYEDIRDVLEKWHLIKKIGGITRLGVITTEQVT